MVSFAFNLYNSQLLLAYILVPDGVVQLSVLPGKVSLVVQLIGKDLLKLLLLCLEDLQGLQLQVHGLEVELGSSALVEALSGGVLGNESDLRHIR